MSSSSGASDVSIVPAKKSRGRDDALALWALSGHSGIERQHHRRQLGRGIVVGEAAADSTAVANLGMSDVTDGLGQQRPTARHAGIGLDRSLAGHGAEPERTVFDRNPGERLDTVEIDQNCGPCQAEVEQRHQALPTGERPRIPAMCREQGDGLGHIARAFVGEWRQVSSPRATPLSIRRPRSYTGAGLPFSPGSHRP